VILSLNLIVFVDKMSAIEHVGGLTFGINDDGVCNASKHHLPIAEFVRQ